MKATAGESSGSSPFPQPAAARAIAAERHSAVPDRQKAPFKRIINSPIRGRPFATHRARTAGSSSTGIPAANWLVAPSEGWGWFDNIVASPDGAIGGRDRIFALAHSLYD